MSFFIYRSPDSASPVIHHLAPLEIIPKAVGTVCSEDFATCAWAHITTTEGISGFIPRGKIAMERDGLVWLVKESGTWKIRALFTSEVMQDDV